MKTYNPIKLAGTTKWLTNREYILERIQRLIRQGDATTCDGIHFKSHFAENRVRRDLGL